MSIQNTECHFCLLPNFSARFTSEGFFQHQEEGNGEGNSSTCPQLCMVHVCGGAVSVLSLHCILIFLSPASGAKKKNPFDLYEALFNLCIVGG